MIESHKINWLTSNNADFCFGQSYIVTKNYFNAPFSCDYMH